MDEDIFDPAPQQEPQESQVVEQPSQRAPQQGGYPGLGHVEADAAHGQLHMTQAPHPVYHDTPNFPLDTPQRDTSGNEEGDVFNTSGYFEDDGGDLFDPVDTDDANDGRVQESEEEGGIELFNDGGEEAPRPDSRGDSYARARRTSSPEDHPFYRNANEQYDPVDDEDDEGDRRVRETVEVWDDTPPIKAFSPYLIGVGTVLCPPLGVFAYAAQNKSFTHYVNGDMDKSSRSNGAAIVLTVFAIVIGVAVAAGALGTVFMSDGLQDSISDKWDSFLDLI